MAIALDAIRNCLDGAIPAVIATCAPDGMPNVAYLSEVHYVDAGHVALSFQFFSKTRQNVQANPQATVQVVDPDTAAHYRLRLEYLRTETDGPLFERMKAKLAGIASHTGMGKVFRLLGADIYRVLEIDSVAGCWLPPQPTKRHLLPLLRGFSGELSACHELAGLLERILSGLERLFGIHHAMLLMHDAAGQRLYTVATRGYAESGVGSEIALGEGVIGVAAQQRTPIRITHLAQEYAYSAAVRQHLSGPDAALETEIPLPGLAQARSQLAVPIVLGQRLFGVLYVESPEDARFGHDDEDALVTLAGQIALAMQVVELQADAGEPHAVPGVPAEPAGGLPAVIRRYTCNDSVFIDGDYLIKGVAGAIFWKLVRDYAGQRRTEFNNRELRLDPSIRLPDSSDNLEARLILLQRRLAERGPGLGIEKTGRGRFRLRVDREIRLEEIAAAPAG